MTTRREFIQKMGMSMIATPTILNCYGKETPPQVTIGTITYSFREMSDQTADALLQYVVDSGVRSIELMGDPAERFAGKPMIAIDFRSVFPLLRKRYEKQELSGDELKTLAEFDQQVAANRKEAAAWRKTASMSKFAELKKKYKRAGVSIYAFKPDCFGRDNTDAEIHFGMRAAKELGASHVTLEHPGDDAHTLKLASIAEPYNMKVGYHGHEQETPTFWDVALGQSKANAVNLDLGHYVAGGNSDPLGIIQAKHDRISSMHLKDRKTPEHGKGNVSWGNGDTPIAGALKLMRDNGYKFPATIELEYEVPKDSNPVKEVRKCYEFCMNALATK